MYINSTNTKLNLKKGQLSQLLLSACGDDLQKECSEYAPLKPGQVAVTGAKNLKCNQLFHIALPDYKTANSERVSCSLRNKAPYIYMLGIGAILMVHCFSLYRFFEKRFDRFFA